MARAPRRLWDMAGYASTRLGPVRRQCGYVSPLLWNQHRASCTCIMTLLPFLALPVVIGGIGFAYLQSTLKMMGVIGDRNIDFVGNSQCEKIPELAACEDSWLHQKSGLLYLACSDPIGRTHWTPAIDRLNSAKRPDDDYIAFLDTRATGPYASRITKLSLKGFTGNKGNGVINAHGIGVHVVDDTVEQPTLRIFLNNHRPPFDSEGHPVDAAKVGANSTLELFETTLGSSTLHHLRTWHDPLIKTPNRAAPVSADSFIVSNDHAVKVGFVPRELEIVRPGGSLVYCNTEGCKTAFGPIQLPNGIIPLSKGNLYAVPSSSAPKIKIFELQADGTLVFIEDIHIGYPVDNLTVDADGNMIAAAFPFIFKTLKHFGDPIHTPAPVTVFRISLNTGQSSFYGEKWKVEKLFEDDGSKASGITTASYDKQTKKLWLSGLQVPYTTVCQL